MSSSHSFLQVANADHIWMAKSALTRALVSALVARPIVEVVAMAKTTPAHLLAASAPIQKELADCLHSHCVEARAFKECDNSIHHKPTSALRVMTAQTTEFSLQLHEVDVLINNKTMEPGVLDQGSRIIVI